MQPLAHNAVGAHDATLAEQGHPSNWKNPSSGDSYDLVVIGGGPGGLVASITAAAVPGRRVALIERHLTGGTCVNYGCTPSKALIACARAASDAGRLGKLFGYHLPSGSPQVDFASVMERVREMRVNSSSFDSVQAVTGAGVHVFLGDARFVSRDAVEVEGRRLTFKSAVIASGARPRLPDVDGLKQAGFLTNETVFGLTQQPKKLVLLGSGPVGCELAQAFRKLGSEVDLITRGDRLLPKEASDANAIIRKQFEHEGIKLHFGLSLTRVEKSGNVKRLTTSSGTTLECDELIVCVGRVPNVEGLGLEAAGVQATALGIEVNDHLQTSNSAIFAVGDCCKEGYKFTHAAMAMGGLAAHNAFVGKGLPLRAASAVTIPWCTYTHPEVAQVGLTPEAAAKKGVEIDTHRLDLKMIERSVIEGQAEGFGAIYTAKGSGKIVGATLVSAHAGEAIPLITTFMQHGMPLEALSAVVHCYPTQAEVFKRIADGYASKLVKK